MVTGEQRRRGTEPVSGALPAHHRGHLEQGEAQQEEEHVDDFVDHQAAGEADHDEHAGAHVDPVLDVDACDKLPQAPQQRLGLCGLCRAGQKTKLWSRQREDSGGRLQPHMLLTCVCHCHLEQRRRRLLLLQQLLLHKLTQEEPECEQEEQLWGARVSPRAQPVTQGHRKPSASSMTSDLTSLTCVGLHRQRSTNVHESLTDTGSQSYTLRPHSQVDTHMCTDAYTYTSTHIVSLELY